MAFTFCFATHTHTHTHPSPYTPPFPAANEWATASGRIKLGRILLALVRGMRCFDAAYFSERNPDTRRCVLCAVCCVM
jgi:alkanesulfonate monooxygenase SsuD/methylene tetrahydromethanopterin reductase-like flavin-dependent oxidoreductase (luciferase family)